jgi:mono/diheme cytochrome c family protein
MKCCSLHAPLLKIAAMAAFFGTMLVTLDAHAQNIERGRALYENHCQVCHSAQIHGRKARTALSASELRGIVDLWQRNQALRWSTEEIDDVVQFLSATRYFFSG